MMRVLKTYLGITRSYAPVLMCLGALIGMLISRGYNLSLWEVVTPLLSLYFLTAASFVFNDIFDLEVDKANNISRPLVTGELSLNTAWVLWVVLTISGISLLVFLVSLEPSLLLMASYALSLLYTVKIKKYGLPGNVVVSLLVSLSLVYGALSVNRSFPVSMSSIVFLVFLLNLAREVIQGIADAPGDSMKGVRSVSVRYGVRAAKILGGALIILKLASAPFIIQLGDAKFFNNQNMLYGYVLIAVGFTYVLYELWASEGVREIRRVLALINLLTIALIALIIASIAV